MEPNKIEKEFKNKLAERTIQPSAQAWDRLDAMLAVTEDKKPRKKRTWLYMAASFIVFFTIGAFLLQQEKSTNNDIIIEDAVVTTTTEPNIENESLQSTTEVTEPKVEAGSTVIKSSIKQQRSVAVTTQPASGMEQAPAYNINQNSIDKKEAIEVPITDYKREEVAVTSNTNTEKTIIKKAKRGITVNPDELLASVEERDVNTGNMTTLKSNDSKVKINANSLLSSAEREVNESFRGKVLNSVIKNYNAVKTSVANRNYQ